MKALVLSSGGIDSTTCISLAIEKYGKENVSTVSFFYGQKHKKELECADKIAKWYGVTHYVLNISEILSQSNCSLLGHSDKDIVHLSYQKQIEKNGEGMVETYVPFRNGLMLSAAASLAMSICPNDKTSLFLGAHADDAAGRAYADCSTTFVDYMKLAISEGTYEKVSIESPLINLNKSQVVSEGLRLNSPYQLTWSCYEGGTEACGTCGTCVDRLEAFQKNDRIDPIQYVK